MQVYDLKKKEFVSRNQFVTLKYGNIMLHTGKVGDKISSTNVTHILCINLINLFFVVYLSLRYKELSVYLFSVCLHLRKAYNSCEIDGETQIYFAKLVYQFCNAEFVYIVLSVVQSTPYQIGCNCSWKTSILDLDYVNFSLRIYLCQFYDFIFVPTYIDNKKMCI